MEALGVPVRSTENTRVKDRCGINATFDMKFADDCEQKLGIVGGFEIASDTEHSTTYSLCTGYMTDDFASLIGVILLGSGAFANFHQVSYRINSHYRWDQMKLKGDFKTLFDDVSSGDVKYGGHLKADFVLSLIDCVPIANENLLR